METLGSVWNIRFFTVISKKPHSSALLLYNSLHNYCNLGIYRVYITLGIKTVLIMIYSNDTNHIHKTTRHTRQPRKEKHKQYNYFKVHLHRSYTRDLISVQKIASLLEQHKDAAAIASGDPELFVKVGRKQP